MLEKKLESANAKAERREAETKRIHAALAFHEEQAARSLNLTPQDLNP